MTSPLRKILCLGDSLTNGARDEYYRNYPMELSDLIVERRAEFYLCLNAGVNGDTTSHIRDRAASMLPAHRDARFVLLLGGTNDSKVPIPPEIFRSNVLGILRLAEAVGVEPVIGLLPPVFGPGLPCYVPARGNEEIRRYNEVLTLVAAQGRVRCADFSGYGSDLFSDGVHMNHAGYRRMAHDWYTAIESGL
jgi:lysophospholipase L1-like esterase